MNMHVASTFNADALAAYKPQPPAGAPWADYWYAYINDPEVGFFKIAFLSSLKPGQSEPQSAYLHIAFFPLGGGFREYDFYADNVTLDAGAGDNPQAFRFEVPGAAVISHDRIELTLPEARLSATIGSDHAHYWNQCNPANGPFTPEADTPPGAASHWFIYTLGTPVEYQFGDAHDGHSGKGMIYIERGWSSSAAPGFTYLVATSEHAKLMLVEGGKSSGRGGEIWAGKLILGEHRLRLLPMSGDYEAHSVLDASRGAMSLDLEQRPYRLELRASAPLTDFYDQVTPSQTIFSAQHPVMKTMNAALDITLYKEGNVVEQIALPQSILEFAGAAYPPGWRECA
ncbi:MAG: hypothetical protein KDE25_11385 [Novosphingobium sp.]|nr:hypothetical protein [Novosphingobium sp.]